MKDNLGDRIKQYEDAYRFHLISKMPVIIRLDGKAFHSYTKYCNKPYDDRIINCMRRTSIALCQNISNVKVAYTQSDEISLLLINYSNLNTQPFFNNNIQKIVSVAASIASVEFTLAYSDLFKDIKPAYFDARAFILPKEEVNNYFIWRQNDCRRNSILTAAQSQFSTKQLHGKNKLEMKQMLLSKNVDWENFSNKYINGTTIIKTFVNNRSKWTVDEYTPLFSKSKNYIEKYVNLSDKIEPTSMV